MRARYIKETFPDFEDFKALDAPDLGMIMLRMFVSDNQRSYQITDISYPLTSGQDHKYPSGMTRLVEDRIGEALDWLKSQGLLTTDVRQSASFFRVSRLGERINSEAAADAYLRASTISPALFHPTVRDKVWSLMLRGDRSTAVFHAFKAVEVAVRDAANFPADNAHIGVRLMRAAFSPDKNGPLCDQSAEKGEQNATMELFTGAIGLFKNPHSHRNIEIDTDEEAAEMIVLASHLIRIVENRNHPVNQESRA